MPLSIREIAAIIGEEIGAPWKAAVDSFTDSVQPIDFLVVTNLLLKAVDAIQDFQRGVTLAPVKIMTRVLVGTATAETSTKVMTVRAAQQFAADVLTVAIYDLIGEGPPPLLKEAAAATHLVGIRAAIHKVLVGKILGPIFRFFRVIIGLGAFPVRAIQIIASTLTTLFILVFACGSVLCLLWILTSDWDSVALSQQHPRKRLKNQSINKRL